MGFSQGGEISATAIELGTQPGEFTTLPVTPLEQASGSSAARPLFATSFWGFYWIAVLAFKFSARWKARPAATHRADGGCGRSLRWSSSKIQRGIDFLLPP